MQFQDVIRHLLVPVLYGLASINFGPLLVAQNLYPVKINNQWGLIDNDGLLVVEPTFQAIGAFDKHGFATVQKNNALGLIDQEGQAVLPVKYKDIKALLPNLFLVTEGAVSKVISRNERTILQDGFNDIKLLSSTFLAYKQGTSWGVSDINGQTILPPTNDRVSLLPKQIFEVERGGRIGLFDISGRAIIRPEYDEVQMEPEQVVFTKKGNYWSVFQQPSEGPLVIGFTSYEHLDDQFYRLQFGDRTALYSTEAARAISDPEIQEFYAFSPQLVLCKKDRKWGLINAKGAWLIPVSFDEIQTFSSKVFRVKKDGKWGLYTDQNEEILPIAFDFISPPKGNLAVVKNGKQMGLINTDGVFMTDEFFDEVEINDHQVKALQGSKLLWFSINEEGDQLLQNEGEFTNHFTLKVKKLKKDPTKVTSQGRFQLEKFEWFYSSAEDRWGLRNIQDGQIVITPSFDWIRALPNLPFSMVGMKTRSRLRMGNTTFSFQMVFGLISNTNGELVCELNLLDLKLEDFEAGLSIARCVFKDGSHGLINKNGVVIQRGLTYIDAFKEDRARFCTGGYLAAQSAASRNNLQAVNAYFNDFMAPCSVQEAHPKDIEVTMPPQLYCEEGSWGYIDTQGQIIVHASFSLALSMENGVGIAIKSEKWGAVNPKGELLIPFQYDLIEFLDNTNKKILRIFNHQKKYGIIDSLGNLAVRTEYDDLGAFSEGRLAVRHNNLWGYTNKKGHEVIPCRFHRVGNFKEGFAAVEIGVKWGFINKQGDFVIPAEYIRVGDFNSGLAGVKGAEGWGYINSKGEIAIPLQFEYAENFEGEVARVKVGSKWGLIDLHGNFLIRPGKFTQIFAFQENGLAKVQMGSSKIKYGLINKKGQLITTQAYQDIDQFYEGLAAVKITDKYGYLNTQGKVCIAPVFSKAGRFSEGRAAVRQDGYCGYVNGAGEMVIAPSFIECMDFQSGRAVVYENQRKTGLIDEKGEYVINPEIDQLVDFSDGRGLVKEGNYKFFYITEENQITYDYYNKAGKFSNGVAVVQNGGKWGIVNHHGVEIIPPKYDKIGNFIEGYAKVRIKGFHGITNLKGKLIVQPEYEYISYAGGGVFRIEQGGKVGYLNDEGSWIWPPSN